MSQDRKDMPRTAKTGKTSGRDHSSNKPQRGELFVRTSGGSVLLTQTMKLFGRKS